MPVTDLLPLGTRLNYAFAEVRAARALLLTFGGLALVLSAIGLYAALAFAVTQRSREIAIPVALGAARSDVSKLVLRHGLTIVSIAMAIDRRRRRDGTTPRASALRREPSRSLRAAGGSGGAHGRGAHGHLAACAPCDGG